MNPRPTESTNGNGGPWYIRVLEKFGLSVVLILMFMSGFAFIGQWMIENQSRLIDSTIKTNESLTTTNGRMADTLDQIRISTASASAVVLEAVQSNGEVMRKQSAVLESAEQTHLLQSTQIAHVVTVIDAANELMKPVPAQRADSLKKQDETNATLRELVDELKRKNP